MTETYWQRYNELNQQETINRPDNLLWQETKKQLSMKNDKPKHHLELLSMCKSENPYIRQIKNSPNITTNTVAELICRDKACDLQYCMSILVTANENRRKLIDLKGCTAQYDNFRECMNEEITRINKQEDLLKQAISGEIPLKQVQTELKEQEQPALIEVQYM